MKHKIRIQKIRQGLWVRGLGVQPSKRLLQAGVGWWVEKVCQLNNITEEQVRQHLSPEWDCDNTKQKLGLFIGLIPHGVFLNGKMQGNKDDVFLVKMFQSPLIEKDKQVFFDIAIDNDQITELGVPGPRTAVNIVNGKAAIRLIFGRDTDLVVWDYQTPYVLIQTPVGPKAALVDDNGKVLRVIDTPVDDAERAVLEWFRL